MELERKRQRRAKKEFGSHGPNPLFAKWLTEWRDEAVHNGWKKQHLYQKALTSLRKYPLPLTSGKDAKMLQYFGDTICKMLDDKLAEHTAVHGAISSCGSASASTGEAQQPAKASSSDSKTSAKPPNKIRKTSVRPRDYVPAPRSAPHALLVTLYKYLMMEGPRAGMKKDRLIDAAQPLCDKSFKIPEPGGFYTCWASMGTLIKRGAVLKEGSPASYRLTTVGEEIAAKLLDMGNSQNSASSQQSNAGASSPSQSNCTTGFQYCYVSSSGAEVKFKDQACVIIDDDISSGFLIKCKKSDLLSSGKRFKMDATRQPIGDWVFAYLENDAAENISLPQLPLMIQDQLSARLSGPDPFPTMPPFCLAPGTFEIVLCVDNAETLSGGSNDRKMAVQSELRKNGVTYDVRKLNVGDFVWVARAKVTPVPGQLALPRRKELVLDYVVERKRMDDLAKSIKDGRFHEQKFRLKSCGLRKPIYLVESMGSSSRGYLGLPESTLAQAITNTQVVDGFSVKQSVDQAGSITFLTVMTRYLQSAFSNQMLVGCSRSESRTSDCQLLSFEEFNSTSVKKKETTIKEMFAKQLMQLNSISADKATAIIDKYNTPNSLLKAYEECPSQADKDNLLSGVKYGKLKRNIGPSVSKSLSLLYTSDTLV